MYTGIVLDRFIGKDPKKSSYLENVLFVNLQVVLITVVSVYGRPQVLKRLGVDAIKISGVGILYAYALLLGQEKFNNRIKELTKL